MEEKLRLMRLSQRLRFQDEGRGRLGHLYKKILTALHRQRKVCHPGLQPYSPAVFKVARDVFVVSDTPRLLCSGLRHVSLLRRES